MSTDSTGTDIALMVKPASSGGYIIIIIILIVIDVDKLIRYETCAVPYV